MTKIKQMIRTSQHILKDSNNCKVELLDKLFEDYKSELQCYVDLIISEKLELKKFLSILYTKTTIL